MTNPSVAQGLLSLLLQFRKRCNVFEHGFHLLGGILGNLYFFLILDRFNEDAKMMH